MKPEDIIADALARLDDANLSDQDHIEALVVWLNAIQEEVLRIDTKDQAGKGQTINVQFLDTRTKGHGL